MLMLTLIIKITEADADSLQDHVLQMWQGQAPVCLRQASSGLTSKRSWVPSVSPLQWLHRDTDTRVQVHHMPSGQVSRRLFQGAIAHSRSCGLEHVHLEDPGVMLTSMVM